MQKSSHILSRFWLISLWKEVSSLCIELSRAETLKTSSRLVPIQFLETSIVRALLKSMAAWLYAVMLRAACPLIDSLTTACNWNVSSLDECLCSHNDEITKVIYPK